MRIHDRSMLSHACSGHSSARSPQPLLIGLHRRTILANPIHRWVGRAWMALESRGTGSWWESMACLSAGTDRVDQQHTSPHVPPDRVRPYGHTRHIHARTHADSLRARWPGCRCQHAQGFESSGLALLTLVRWFLPTRSLRWRCCPQRAPVHGTRHITTTIRQS